MDPQLLLPHIPMFDWQLSEDQVQVCRLETSHVVTVLGEIQSRRGCCAECACKCCWLYICVSLLESQHLLENQVAHKATLGGLWSRCSVENKMFKKD